jgi:hypothetical protein
MNILFRNVSVISSGRASFELQLHQMLFPLPLSVERHFEWWRSLDIVFLAYNISARTVQKTPFSTVLLSLRVDWLPWEHICLLRRYSATGLHATICSFINAEIASPCMASNNTRRFIWENHAGSVHCIMQRQKGRSALLWVMTRTTIILAKVVGLWAEIWTTNFPNAKQES